MREWLNGKTSEDPEFIKVERGVCSFADSSSILSLGTVEPTKISRLERSHLSQPQWLVDIRAIE